jgi:MFS superfamily sulfate permease-like transporter
MSNLWMGLFIILTLVCLTSLLEMIPLAVLGAVIESAVMSLIDFGEMHRVRFWCFPGPPHP